MLYTHSRNQILKSVYQKLRKIYFKFKRVKFFIFFCTIKISSFLQSRKHAQYVPGSNNFWGVEVWLRILLSSLRQAFEEPTTSGYLSAVLWEEGEEKDGRERKERRIREAARQIESSDKAACSIEAAELLILITQLGERLRGRKGSRNKLTATASVPNLPPPSLHQPTTHHIAHTGGVFPLPSTPSSFQHSCIAIIHPQRHYVGID